MDKINTNHLVNTSANINIYNNVRFLLNYQDEKVKEIVKKSKNLDKVSIKIAAKYLYGHILDSIKDLTLSSDPTKKQDKIKVLIFHCPSSSFARNDKKRDHMAMITEQIKEFHDNHMQDNSSSINLIELDIYPHAILIDADSLESQHHRKREQRISDSEGRFSMLSLSLFKFDPNFINSYQIIYILDDVLTTGATLNNIKALITNHIKETGVQKDGLSSSDNRTDDICPIIKMLALCH